MNTFREAIYMVLDLLKLQSDDAYYTEEHIAYLLDKYRAYVLSAKKDEDLSGELSDSNYQIITLDLEKYMPVEECSQFGVYLRSTTEIPDMLDICIPKIFTINSFLGHITFVSPERFKYVNSNKYTKNFIYVTIDRDNRLYLKSCNPQAYYLEQISLSGIFESASDMAELIAENSNDCKDWLDLEFPLQSDLVGLVIDYVVKVLFNSTYRPTDNNNDAHDNLEGLYVKEPKIK